MKKILMIAEAILVAALIAAGSFWGGMAYQSNKSERARLAFENARGDMPEGQNPGERQGFPGGLNGQNPGFMGGGGTNGVVKTVEGNVITISTAQNVTTVNLSDTTRIQKSVSGTAADLQPGVRVMVSGQEDADGAISAAQITILNNDFPAGPAPSATESEQ